MSLRLRLGLLLAIIAGVFALAVVWGVISPAEWRRPAFLWALAGQLIESPWSAPIVFVGIVLAQQLAVPQFLLVVVGVLVLGPWEGFTIVYVATVVGACLGYAIGRFLGRRPLRRLGGHRIRRLSRLLARRGVRNMTIINLLPIGPQMAINLAAGSTHLRFRDFLLGTAFGTVPPTVLAVVSAELLLHLGRAPTWWESAAALLALAILGLLGWWLSRLAWQWIAREG